MYKKQQAKLEAGLKIAGVVTENESNLYTWGNEKWMADIVQ
ncbi:MAG: hypothetical protein WKF97_04790 [Chitinophagaceae bacterium]